MSKISFVYFDVGGVAIRDFSASSKWETMKKDMGLPRACYSEYEDYYHSIEPDLCLGKFEVDNLIPEIETKFNFHFPPRFSMLSYFVDHFEANEALYPIYNELKTRGLKLGLLTDQYPRMLNLIFSRKLLSAEDFDVIVDSTVVKLKKPDPRIYKLAGEKAAVPASEILFVDNSQKNIDGATTAGWQTYFYDSRDYDQANRDLAKFLGFSGK